MDRMAASPGRSDPNDLAQLIAPLVRGDGYTASALDGVTLMTCHREIPRTPLLYEPGVIAVAQGEKIGHLGDRRIRYGPGSYLVQTLPLPFECETLATPQQPMLGLQVRIDPAVLSELVAASGPDAWPAPQEEPRPMAAVPMSAGMHEALARLLRALHDPLDARVMGRARVREVVFEALKGAQGPALRALVWNQGSYARIVQALSRMHAAFDQELRVEELARQANMSVSAFHGHFRAIARTSPLQYLKGLRLIKARLLLSQHGYNVNQTAAAVGYRSVAQFSRDYKRTFGETPSRQRARPDVLEEAS